MCFRWQHKEQENKTFRFYATLGINSPNNALHRTAIPLRSIAAGELNRWQRMRTTYGQFD
jgi:hypothetical protein